VFVYSSDQHILCCVFCFVFLRLVYPMLPVSLDCLRPVYPMLPVSLDCLRPVYPMLPVSLDCPVFIAPSVFSNVYWLWR
jgi:hypothetical protein